MITVVFFVAQVIMGIAMAIGMAVYMVVSRGTTDASLLADAIKLVTLPSAIAGEIVGALLIFWMTRRVLRGPLKGGGLASVGWRTAVVSETALAALAGCLLSLFYLFVLVRIAPPAGGQTWGPLANAAHGGGWPLHLWALLALLLAPPIEEFVFRGILLEGLSNSLGVKTATIIVTVAFVLTHITEALAYWPAWAAISLLAISTLYFRFKTRSLVPAISAHFGYNLVMVVVAYTGAA